MQYRFAVHVTQLGMRFILETARLKANRCFSDEAWERISNALTNASADGYPDEDGTGTLRYPINLSQGDWAALMACMRSRRLRAAWRVAFQREIIKEMEAAGYDAELVSDLSGYRNL